MRAIWKGSCYLVGDVISLEVPVSVGDCSVEVLVDVEDCNVKGGLQTEESMFTIDFPPYLEDGGDESDEVADWEANFVD